MRKMSFFTFERFVLWKTAAASCSYYEKRYHTVITDNNMLNVGGQLFTMFAIYFHYVFMQMCALFHIENDWNSSKLARKNWFLISFRN